MDSNTTLESLLGKASETFSKYEIDFALAGGLIADVYRGEPRTTDDLDFVVALDNKDLDKAKNIIADLGYSPKIITEAELKGNTRFRRQAARSTPQIIIGRSEEKTLWRGSTLTFSSMD